MSIERASSREWERYGIRGPGDRAAAEVLKVYHICHLEEARRIFEDGLVRSSLVWDESKLRNSRTCVSWVSPNDWVHGSIYGSVRLTFAWSEIAAGKRFYWVEDVRTYNPPAFRILVTDKHYDRKLTPYNPATSAGPLIYVKSAAKWYRNFTFTGELLVDGDLALEDCTCVDFVDHHESYCSKSGRSCSFFGMDKRVVGSRFLATLLGSWLIKSPRLFHASDTKPKRLHAGAAGAWRVLHSALTVDGPDSGRIRAGDDAAEDIVRAVWLNYGRNRRKAAKRLCNLFRSTEELRLAAESVALSAFKLRSRDGLDDQDE